MRFNKEIKIGLLALISGSILYFGFNFLKGIDFLQSTNTFYAFYDQVNGLGISNQVQVNGFSVGRVSDIKIIQGKPTRVLVAMEVNRDITIGENAIARLELDLLGSKTINLQTGDITKPLKGNDTIIGVLRPGLAEEFSEQALPLVDELDSTIRNINAFLKSYTAVSNEIQKTFVEAQGVLTSSKKMIDENRGNLKIVTGNLSATTEEFKKSSAELTVMLENMKQVSDSLTQLEINKTLNTLNSTMASIDTITSTIAAGEGTMGKLVNNDSLYNNLNSVSQNLDSLLIDLKEHPKRYVHFSIFGKKDK